MLNYISLQVQLGTSLNWRCHLEGVYELMMLRGGFQAMTRSKVLKPLLRCLWVYVIPITTINESNTSTNLE